MGASYLDIYLGKRCDLPMVLLVVSFILLPTEAFLTHNQTETQRDGLPISREKILLSWIGERAWLLWFD